MSDTTHRNLFRWRTDVWLDTKNRASQYPCSASVKIVHDPEYRFKSAYTETLIRVENEDSIVIGCQLAERGLRPLVLNFADDVYAGGAVDVGSGAQEESLFRRTNLCETLMKKDNLYPILPNEALYTERATVFKNTERYEYAPLENVCSLAFVAVPGIKFPNVTDAGRFGDADADTLRMKVDLILQVAHKHGHRSVVLGALGCGAWRCPPQHVAEIFRDVLEEWHGVFDEIVFACLEFGEHGYSENPMGIIRSTASVNATTSVKTISISLKTVELNEDMSSDVSTFKPIRVSNYKIFKAILTYDE